uniref:Antimicrobial peptide type 1 If n=1 Tax=Pandalus japonicus TaxID=666362 RepID=T1W4D2_PANJP|nr:antimicrobial peptide type 1 precursor If [Pandalus japonicus]
MKTVGMSLVMLALATIVCATSQAPPGDKLCTRYCPEGGFGNYICCDDHPGQCPVLRPICPETRISLRPVPCQHDGHCTDHQKCCYDVCLPGKKVCKPAN